MYLIKQLPEDFIVKETSQHHLQEQGKYLYFRLQKIDQNTLDVIKRLAKVLGLKDKEIGFAGSKDKKAVTEQLCSIPSRYRERLLGISWPLVTLTPAGYSNQPLTLGDLEGNYFEIVVRNLDTIPLEKIKFIPNYFDEQRFGLDNEKVGRLLVQKRFLEATAIVHKEEVKKYLQNYPQDAVGALKMLPRRLLRMYVNAYQSYLWNKTAAEYFQQFSTEVQEVPYLLGTFIFPDHDAPFRTVQIPMLGFNTEPSAMTPELRLMINRIMEEEHLSTHDFIIKQIPELTLEGGSRSILAEVKDFSIGRAEPDELHPGKQKVKLVFSLGKGSYATMVIRRWFVNGTAHQSLIDQNQ